MQGFQPPISYKFCKLTNQVIDFSHSMLRNRQCLPYSSCLRRQVLYSLFAKATILCFALLGYLISTTVMKHYLFLPRFFAWKRSALFWHFHYRQKGTGAMLHCLVKLWIRIPMFFSKCLVLSNLSLNGLEKSFWAYMQLSTSMAKEMKISDWS